MVEGALDVEQSPQFPNGFGMIVGANIDITIVVTTRSAPGANDE